MKIEKRIISYTNFKLHIIYRVYNETLFLNHHYPNISNWFWNKVVPEIQMNQRYIIVYTQRDIIVGASILKSTIKEKKICTLYIQPNFQSLGYGKQLMADSLDVLKIRKPIITVSEDNLHQYIRLFKHYNFNLSEIRKDIYIKGIKEYVYNGKLK